MVENNFDYMHNQLHAGDNIRYNPNGKFSNDKLWHTNSEGKYWCGNWYSRTPSELLEECTTTIRDLLLNHPDLINKRDGK